MHVLKQVIITSAICLFTATTYAQIPACLQVSNGFSSDSLMQFVFELTGRQQTTVAGNSVRIASRQFLHPGNRLAEAYLRERFTTYGFTVSTDTFSITGVNIIAYKTGTQFPDKAILLCAHFDNVGNATAPFEGADDNASGTAALLETARLLANVSTDYSIILAAWDEEERGLLGSKAWAPAGNGMIEPIAIINMDMIAYDGNNDSLLMMHVLPQIPGSLPLAQRIVELNSHYGIQLNPFIRNPGDPASDHQAFWITGSNAIGYSEDYDNDFNPHWHRFSDSVYYFNLPYYYKMAKLSTVTVCDMAITGKFTSAPLASTVSNLRLLYSNPVSSHMWVSLQQPGATYTIKLIDLRGVCVWTHDISDNESFPLPLEVADGIYMMQVVSEQRTFAAKILVNKN